MSENQNRGAIDLSKYDAMTTEELAEILRLDTESLEGEATDGEVLFYVMEVLSKRYENSNHSGKTAQQAWESFEKNYLPSVEEPSIHIAQTERAAKTTGPWLRRMIAAVAVIVVLVGLPLTASAFGWEDIWNAVANWARETFSFVTEESSQNTEPATENIQQYTSLQDLLIKTNRKADLVPTWIPDGYELVDIRLEETPVQKTYMARYDNADARLRISVKSFVAADPEKVEIDEELIEIYEYSDIEYYIVANMDQMKAVWIKDSYECYISGDLTVEEIKQMIDSIGKG